MANGEGAGGDGGNRSVLANAVRYLGLMTQALQNLGPTTVGVSTYAGLPSSPIQGDRRLITDSNTATFNATAAGGGSNIVPVFWNGTNWKVG